MAVKRFYLVDGVDANGWQALSESTQSAADSAAGWVHGTGATNSSELEAGVIRASTTFVGNTVPDGTLDTALGDAFRTPAALTGAFPAGNWTFQFAVRSLIQAGAADGFIVFRLIKADADGSNAVEITAAQQTASTVTNVASGADSNSSLTLNPGVITLNNQYLFVQVAWRRSGAGGMTTTNIRLRTGSASAPTGTVIVTTDFGETLTRNVGDESLKLADTVAARLNPQPVAVDTESLKVQDTVQAFRVDSPLAVNLQESLRLIDLNQGVVQLIGVLHVTDGPVVAELVADTSLSASVQESLKLADTVAAVEDLTARPFRLSQTALDDFNRADGGLGSNWTDYRADPVLISGNQVPGQSVGLGTGAYYTGIPFDANQYAKAKVAAIAAGQTIALNLRHAGTLNTVTGYRVSFGATGGVTVSRMSGTSGTFVAGGSGAALAVNDIIEARILGDRIDVLVNGVVRATGFDSTYTSGSPGFDVFATTVAIDDFEAGHLAGERIRISDTVSATLVEGAADLSRAVADEVLKLVDGPVSARTNPDHIVLSETLLLADTLTAARGLTASLQEDLKIADAVFADENPRDIFGLNESLKLADTVTAARDLTASLQEDLKLADALTAVRDLTASLQEDLKLADVQLTTLDPEEASIAEALKLADTVTTSLDPEQAIFTEDIKVADTVTASRFDFLEVGISESLRVMDFVFGAARFVASQNTRTAGLMELPAFKTTDGPVVASVGLSQVVATENLKISDEVSAQLTTLLVSLTEALKLADASSQTLDPEETSKSEALRIADTLTASRGLDATLGENIRLADVLTASRGLTAEFGEDLRITDSVFAARDLEVTITAEALKCRDEDPLGQIVQGGQVTQVETLLLADAVSAALDPLQTTLEDALRCAESLVLAPSYNVVTSISFGDEVFSANTFSAEVMSGAAFGDEALSESVFNDEELLPA